MTALDLLNDLAARAKAAIETAAAAKRRSGFTTASSLTRVDGPPPDHANPHRLDTAPARAHVRIVLTATPVKKMVPGAELLLTLWNGGAGTVMQAVTMVETLDENTGNVVRKYDDEHKPVTLNDPSDPAVAAILEESAGRWYSKLVKAIDKEIDRRIRLET